MTQPSIEPQPVVQIVESFVDRTLDSAAKYENSEPLDGSNVYELHLLAAEVYALGFDEGTRVATTRVRAQQQRDRNRSRS